MTAITVALLQLPACHDQAANLAKGEACCRCARQMGADIALFPELWQLGYHFECPPRVEGPAGNLWRAPGLWRGQRDPRTPEVEDAVAAYHARAIGTDSGFVNHLRRPHRYGLLTALGVQEPFIRVDAQSERYDPTRR